MRALTLLRTKSIAARCVLCLVSDLCGGIRSVVSTSVGTDGPAFRTGVNCFCTKTGPGGILWVFICTRGFHYRIGMVGALNA